MLYTCNNKSLNFDTARPRYVLTQLLLSHPQSPLCNISPRPLKGRNTINILRTILYFHYRLIPVLYRCRHRQRRRELNPISSRAETLHGYTNNRIICGIFRNVKYKATLVIEL